MSTVVVPTAAPATQRSGLAEGWRQTGLVMQWQLRRMTESLPLLVVVQVLSVATIVGYGLLVGTTTPGVGLYLATGAPTVTLITVGLVMTPQMVAQARTEGSLDWMRTLPVPRGVFLLSDLLVWTLIAVPGMVLGVVAGALRFDVALRPAWWLPLAAVVVSLTAASIGYALATVFKPVVAMLMSQVFVFVVMLFSPVSFPAERMPDWAQHLHLWLPFQPMAEAIRAGLAPDDFAISGRAVAVLLVWCAASVTGAALALRRRG